MALKFKNKALVLGVGPEKGLGAALCKRFANEGHHVFVAGRTQKALDKLVDIIEKSGGSATAVVCDAANEQSVINLFDCVEKTGDGRLDLAVYNVGNIFPGTIREMEADYFENSWKVLCYGGFLFGREISRRILPGEGTLIYTGASASLRGKPNFAAFNSGKAGLRIFAQAMAKEYGAEGLHVSHVIIDGGIAGEKLFSQLNEEQNQENLKKFVSLEGLVDAYWMLYQQPAQAWTFELDLRTSVEAW